MSNVAVIYYSSTGTNHAMAEAVAEGARGAGADVRVRLVPETAPEAAIDGNPGWRAFVDRMKDAPRATLADLEWADAVVFGTPTRYGNMAAQLKAFLDTTGGLWFHGKLADKIYAGFTSAQNTHGGQNLRNNRRHSRSHYTHFRYPIETKNHNGIKDQVE